jgi:hypothetical protein
MYTPVAKHVKIPVDMSMKREEAMLADSSWPLLMWADKPKRNQGKCSNSSGWLTE